MKSQEAKQGSGVDVGLISKVFLLSVGITLGIKFIPPLERIPATSAIALSLVFTPTLILGLLLGWRSWQQRR